METKTDRRIVSNEPQVNFGNEHNEPTIEKPIFKIKPWMWLMLVLSLLLLVSVINTEKQHSDDTVKEEVEQSYQLGHENAVSEPLEFYTLAERLFYSGDIVAWQFEETMPIENELNYFHSVSCSHGKVKYKLEGKYELLSGTFVYNGEKKTTSSVEYDYLNPTLQIYCDDELRYSTTLSTTQKTEEFAVDLTGVEYMVIDLTDTYVSYAMGIDHYASGISDFYIYTQAPLIGNEE